MRLLALQPWTPVLTTALLIGCTRDNPAFDDCESSALCLAEESGTRGDGDGDGDPGDGDGESGDGDGEPGDGDGDGDGESGDGDGDGESGDGDGDGDPNALPSCPETALLKLSVVKDTFLVASPEEAEVCIVSWDFEQWKPIHAPSEMPCEVLDFGGAAFHWVCNADSCSSMWLGRFDVGGYADQAPKVVSAHVEFRSIIDNDEPNQITVYPLDADPSLFGQCGDWSAGSGWGDPVSDCKTTHAHAAYPNPWQVDGLANNIAALGAAQLPVGEYFEHEVIIPISTNVAQGWITGEQLHVGMLARSQGWAPTNFILLAQESESPPHLVLEVCSDL